MALLSIRDWHLHFDTAGGDVHALKGVSLDIERGRVLGLAGGSGSGKSQLCLSIFGLAARNGRTSGQIMFEGAPVDQPHALLGSRVAFVFQDPLTALTPHMTIGAQMGEALMLHRQLGRSDARKACRELLDRCRIPESARRLDQYPHELSGGMRQRVMIAQALTTGPELLIADEPTTALDVTVQAQILTLLRDLQRDLGLTLLFITHDMGVMATIADDIAIMDQGQIVETAAAETLFLAPATAQARALIEARQAREPLPPVADVAPVVMDARDIAVHFPISRGLFAKDMLRAVDGVDAQLRAGETLVVIGESGCGKSTFARACMGLVPLTGGTVRISDAATKRDMRRKAQIIFQDPLAALNPRMTVGQSVIEPLETLRPDVATSERRDRAAVLFNDVGLNPDWLARYPHELSGGQNQRVGIARALICEPQLLVCDEAISALDTATARQVMALLREQQQQRGLAILFITHDLVAAADIGNRVMTLYLGRCMESGPAQILLTAPRHPYTQALVASAPVADVAAMRARPPMRLMGEPPSPMDPGAALRFLPSRAGEPGYRPRLIEEVPGHFVSEHD
jgi:peptide/nickel transport system ATP-binding protein